MKAICITLWVVFICVFVWAYHSRQEDMNRLREINEMNRKNIAMLNEINAETSKSIARLKEYLKSREENAEK